MGKRNSQRKNAAVSDSDDTDSLCSSSTLWSDMSFGGSEEVEKDSLLDQSLDDLYEKRGSTREKALESIIEEFSSSLQCAFVEYKFVTLLNLCINNSIKRGSAKEISLASRVIGLLALTSGSGNNGREILEEAVIPISQALKSRSESSKTSSLLECLAVITFVGGNDPEKTERSMQILREVANPKLSNNVVASKPSAAVIAAMISSWAFLLTTMNSWSLGLKQWEESIAYLSSLLDKDDRSIRIAAGEALALVFEIGDFERFSNKGEASAENANKESVKQREGYAHFQGLKAKVLNQVKNLAAEGGGKGSTKKDLNSQRNLFGDVLEFLEDGYPPEISIKIGRDSLSTSSWSQLIQLNFLKHFLKGGFVKHMQENGFLHEVFGFSPTKKFDISAKELVANKLAEKRSFKSPNSVMSKSRTQYMDKQRKLQQNHKIGHFSVSYED